MATGFHLAMLGLIAVWFIAVVTRFRRSPIALVGGLVVNGAISLVALSRGDVTPEELGVNWPEPWWQTFVAAGVGFAVMLCYSPVADWIATRIVREPPNLAAFRPLQESTLKLIAGILLAWILGGVLEELTVRGIVLVALESLLSGRVPGPLATGTAVIVSALGAGLMHLYQGRRAVVIVSQLSIVFGLLFVINGRNLWAVVLCHGLYDTVAMVRFAWKLSKYSAVDDDRG